jgi:hypothetical protein
MTPRQISLARHALGLKDNRKVSYRNYFSVGSGAPDYDDWMEMVRQGNAVRRIGPTQAGTLFGGDDIFHLTRSGATSVLKEGEGLDPEDFPPVPS